MDFYLPTFDRENAPRPGLANLPAGLGRGGPPINHKGRSGYYHKSPIMTPIMSPIKSPIMDPHKSPIRDAPWDAPWDEPYTPINRIM